jgi:uncharacterized coiled-coil protein SlyX
MMEPQERSALVKSIAKFVRKVVRENTSGAADASRVAELQERVMQLETRLANSEKRLSGLDTATAAHRSHLANVETKIGKLIHGDKQ